MSERPWPSEIRHDKATKTLHVAFDDGKAFVLPAEFLRVHSPSAEVQGHGPGQEQLVHGRRHVGIIGVEPVGNYAVKLTFDDLHDTGLFSWDTLHDLGSNQDRLWKDYLDRLAAAGLSREPASKKT